MSDLENNAQEKGTKKRPYNLREKKEKDAAYRSLIKWNWQMSCMTRY